MISDTSNGREVLRCKSEEVVFALNGLSNVDFEQPFLVLVQRRNQKVVVSVYV